MSEAGAAGDENPFAGPSAPIGIQRSMIERTLSLVLRRGLRLALSLLVVSLWAVLVLGADARSEIAIACGIGFVLWLPATTIQARILFFPSPPDPWLLGPDGAAFSDRDSRLWMRSMVAEEIVSALLPLWLIGWVVANAAVMPSEGIFAAMVTLGVLLVTLLGRRLVALVLHEAILDLRGERDDRARRSLEWLARYNVLGFGDMTAFHLARARFRGGDTDGALAALARIRNRRAWSVDLLRAQMAMDRDGTAPARALAASLRDDPVRWPVGETITALADLYDGDDASVVARAARLRSIPDGEAHQYAMLLLAAAQAGSDPAAARATLEAAGWDPARAAARASPWAPLAARLDALRTARGPV